MQHHLKPNKEKDIWSTPRKAGLSSFGASTGFFLGAIPLAKNTPMKLTCVLLAGVSLLGVAAEEIINLDVEPALLSNSTLGLTDGFDIEA